jgi:hypothetical protein
MQQDLRWALAPAGMLIFRYELAWQNFNPGESE